MTERTLRDQIEEARRDQEPLFPGGPRHPKLKVRYFNLLAEAYEAGQLAILDAHTAEQPATASGAEARDLFAFVPHNAVCATDDCAKPASVNFERGGVGRFYCMECFMRIAKGPST